MNTKPYGYFDETVMGKATSLLSKSTFIRSLQCSKSLYLYKFHKNLQDRISEQQQAVFNRGNQVGALARLLFPGGVDVGWKSPLQYKRSVSLTQKQIEAGASVIYEASFVYNNVLVAADILVKRDNNWYAYEVKSATRVSETYIRDAALQQYVIKGSGLNLSGFFLIHINREYKRDTKPSITNLFSIVDITDKVDAMQGFIIENLLKAKHTLQEEEIPDIDIGPHCMNPYPCDFRGYCWGDISKESIFNLTALEEDRKWTLFNTGIKEMKDIPDDFPMTMPQHAQLESLRKDTVVMNAGEIKAIIDKVRYPAAFIHINICRPAVPLFKGTSPYQSFPFGYSMLRMTHVAADYQEEVLLTENGPGLLKQFLSRFLEDTRGMSTIVYFGHQNETAMLRSMISYFPDHKVDIEDRLSRMISLAEIFSKRFFNHPGVAHIEYAIQAADALGIQISINNPFTHIDQAGQIFAALFYEKDFIRIAELRNKLIQNARYQAALVMEIYKVLREETLPEAKLPERTQE